MKIFISCSGDQSRQIAEALRWWLKQVLQASEPYTSSIDLESGARWHDEIATELENTDFGILCVTPDNLNSRWLHFEAGALSKTTDRSRVIPLRYNVPVSTIEPPLSLFQTEEANREGIERIVDAINRRLQHPLAAENLLSTFAMWWPKLEERLNAVQPSQAPAARPREEILSEILSIVRSLHAGAIRPPEFAPAPGDPPSEWEKRAGEALRDVIKTSLHEIPNPPAYAVKGSEVLMLIDNKSQLHDNLELLDLLRHKLRDLNYRLRFISNDPELFREVKGMNAASDI